MEIFELMKKYRQEQIAFYTDRNVRLRAILAIHSTALGPLSAAYAFINMNPSTKRYWH